MQVLKTNCNEYLEILNKNVNTFINKSRGFESKLDDIFSKIDASKVDEIFQNTSEIGNQIKESANLVSTLNYEGVSEKVFEPVKNLAQPQQLNYYQPINNQGFQNLNQNFNQNNSNVNLNQNKFPNPPQQNYMQNQHYGLNAQQYQQNQNFPQNPQNIIKQNLNQQPMHQQFPQQINQGQGMIQSQSSSQI